MSRGQAIIVIVVLGLASQCLAVTPTLYRYWPNSSTYTCSPGTNIQFSIGADDSDGDLWACEWYLGSSPQYWDSWGGGYYQESQWSHTFSSPGTYHVFAYVHDYGGNSPYLHWQINVPNTQPNASRYSPSSSSISIEEGDNVCFTVAASDSDCDLDAAEWFLGSSSQDYNSISGCSDTDTWCYTFNNPGSYYVYAYVYDDHGGEDFTYWAVNVEANEPPNATRQSPSGSTVSVAYGAQQCFTVSVSDPNCDLDDVEWFLGSTSMDFNNVSGCSDSDTWCHTFNSSGTQYVYAYVYDSAGQEDFTYWQVNVASPQPPSINSQSPSPVNIGAGEQACFSLTASDPECDLAHVEWFIETTSMQWDAISGCSASPSWCHVFDDPGNYHVYAYVYDSGDRSDFCWWDVNVAAPTVTVVAPDGGESWTAGSTHTISWSTTGPLDPTVDIQYSTNAGINWQLLTSTENDGSYSWTVHPDAVSSQVLMKVLGYSSGVPYYDTSDAVFSVPTSSPIRDEFSSLGNWNQILHGGSATLTTEPVLGRNVVELTVPGGGSYPAGTGNAVTLENTLGKFLYGSYRARLRAAACAVDDGVGRDEGMVSGFFTYWREPEPGPDGITASSEIDFELLGHDPYAIYLNIWTAEDPASRIGRYINMRTGERMEIAHWNGNVWQPVTALPTADRISDFDCTADHYVYEFEWTSSSVRFYVYDRDRKVELWHYTEADHIPSHQATLILNAWHTDNWHSMSHPGGTLLPPLNDATMSVDWVESPAPEAPNVAPTAGRYSPTSSAIPAVLGETIDFAVDAHDDNGNLAYTEWFFDSSSLAWHNISGYDAVDWWAYTFDQVGTWHVYAYAYDDDLEEAFTWWQISVTGKPGDLNLDGDINLIDHALFVYCLNGPIVGNPGVDPDLFDRADFNDDGHVDLRDFRAFQALFVPTD